MEQQPHRDAGKRQKKSHDGDTDMVWKIGERHKGVGKRRGCRGLLFILLSAIS